MAEVSLGHWNAVGVGMNAVGVIVLFFFGMPFRINTGGLILLAGADPGQDQRRRREKQYTALGYIGLTLILAGSALQAWAGWPS